MSYQSGRDSIAKIDFEFKTQDAQKPHFFYQKDGDYVALMA